MKTRKKFKLMPLIIVLILISVQASGFTKNNEKPAIHGTEITANSIFNELIRNLDSKCYVLQTTSSNIRKRQRLEYAYTSFGQGDVLKQNSNTIIINNVRTSFNDRSHFSGQKTIENFKIGRFGSTILVTINFKTWGNVTRTLSNVTISKGQSGYFITGKYNSGNRTAFCTLAIYEIACLI